MQVAPAPLHAAGAEETVAVADGRVGVLRRGRLAESLALAEIDRLWVVRPASGLLHGDEPFVVAEAGDRLLVLPALTAGAQPVLEALAALAAVPLWEAETENLPAGWRRRLFGLLPLFPLPRAAVHARRTRPDWAGRGPRPASQLFDALGETGHG